MLLTFGLLSAAQGQRSAPETFSIAALPNAPDAAAVETLNEAARSPTQGTAAVSGSVVDANGQPLDGARVALSAPDGSGERVVFSDGAGAFLFADLPAGIYRLAVTAPGMQSFALPDLKLAAQQRQSLPRITLAIAATTQQVTVSVTQVEIAQEQVKEEEKQRVFGVLPNFYSSYIWDAAPLTAGQKFNLAFHSVTDPVEFIADGVAAGVEQATNTFPGYGQGAQGYAKRFGAAYADGTIARILGSAVLPSVLHQDPRYFYKGSGSKKARVGYALSRAVVTRGDNGRSQPNYSKILGDFASGAISNAYHPAGDRGVGLTLGDGFLSIAGNAVDNLVREFVLRRVTPNVPDYKNGQKPEPAAPSP